MDELVGALRALDQLLPDGLPKIRMHLLLRCSENDRKHRDLGGVAEAGKLLQRLLRLAGRRVNFPTMRSTTLSV